MQAVVILIRHAPMKIDKIHSHLQEIKRHIKAAGAEHKGLVSRAEKIIAIAQTLLSENTGEEFSSARMKKLAGLFLEIEDHLQKKLREYADDLDGLTRHNGALENLGRIFSDLHLKPMLESGTQLKSYIRDIENAEFRKSLNRYFRLLREEAIVNAIKSRAVRWDEPLQDSGSFFGRGIDERIIEFPLAFEAASFDKPGKILDVGAAMNLPYVRACIGEPKAQIVHFTQSGDKEICEFLHDRHAYLFGDIRRTDFKDATFDRILCISTLEHVGMDNSRYGENETALRVDRTHAGYLDAVREMLRILTPGGTLAITVPYGRAQDCGWFQVFDTAMIDSIVQLCGKCSVVARYYYYHDGWKEGGEKVETPEKDDDEIGSVCALLITKDAA